MKVGDILKELIRMEYEKEIYLYHDKMCIMCGKASVVNDYISRSVLSAECTTYKTINGELGIEFYTRYDCLRKELLKEK